MSVPLPQVVKEVKAQLITRQPLLVSARLVLFELPGTFRSLQGERFRECPSWLQEVGTSLRQKPCKLDCVLL